MRGLRNKRVERQMLPHDCKSHDGRFLGHPFLSPLKKNGHGNGCRQHPNSYNPNSLYRFIIKFTGKPLRFLCRARLSLSLSVGAKRSLRQAPALSVSGAGSLCVGPRTLRSGPGALFVGLCVGAWHSCVAVSGPLSASGPVFSVSVGANTLCVAPGALGSLCRGPARSERALFRAPALSASRPGVLSVRPGALCLGTRRSLCHGPALSVSGPSGSSAPIRVTPIRTAGSPRTDPVRGPPAQVRVPPIQPGAFPFSRSEPQTSVWGKSLVAVKLKASVSQQQPGRLGSLVAGPESEPQCD